MALLTRYFRDPNRRRQLLKKRVLIACSGGLDSRALLHALHQESGRASMTLGLVHLNHRLRGRAAEEDASFCQSLADEAGIQAFIGELDVQEFASAHGLGLEAAGRRARYAFLAHAAELFNADVVVTAHTASDQAETLLLRIARGTGVDGLSGIPPVRSITEQEVQHARELFGSGKSCTIVRPLLDLERGEIREYALVNELKWVEDQSNGDLNFRRNAVRAHALPALKNIFPRVVRTLSRLATNAESDRAALQDAEDLLIAQLTRIESRVLVHDLLRMTEALRRRVLRRILAEARSSKKPVRADDVEAVLALIASDAGAQSVTLEYGHVVAREGGWLDLKAPRPVAQDVAEVASTELEERGEAILFNGVARATRDPQLGESYGAHPIVLSPHVQEPLTIGAPTPGERVTINANGDTKKVSDLLIDRKVVRSERHSVLVLRSRGEAVAVLAPGRARPMVVAPEADGRANPEGKSVWIAWRG